MDLYVEVSSRYMYEPQTGSYLVVIATLIML